MPGCVQPVGSEVEAMDVASNLDDAIEKNYKPFVSKVHHRKR